MNFKNKTILITGATSGIGKSLAEKLANFNCTLILLSRRLQILEQFKKSFENSNASIYIHQCDVSNKNEIDYLFENFSVFKEIDLAVLNAGIARRVMIDEFDSSIAEETMNTNFMGLVYSIENLLPIFKNKQSGIIAGVSSLADNRGYSGSGFYCASKAAVSIFLEGLREELKPYNINVITVKPGFVRTPMTDQNEFEMPFLMEPSKAADIILNGLIKGERIIQFPLPTVIGSNLMGILPDFIYSRLINLNKKKSGK